MSMRLLRVTMPELLLFAERLRNDFGIIEHPEVSYTLMFTNGKQTESVSSGALAALMEMHVRALVVILRNIDTAPEDMPEAAADVIRRYLACQNGSHDQAAE